jgi:LacI family transcriptional regulator
MVPTRRAQSRRYFICKVKRARVTLRDIAERCGVTATTVSLALRRHNSIPQTTRERIRMMAERLGYRPDPALAALSHYRRHSRLRGTGPTLAYVTGFPTRDGWSGTEFFRRTYRGAAERAQVLGYRIERAWLTEPGMTPERFAAILQSRGIRGLILAPLPRPSGHLELPWEHFSSVSIGPSLTHPVLHSACNNHYQSLLLAMERLEANGYHRVGLVLDPEVDRRHQQKYQAAFFMAKPPDAPRPLVATVPSDAELLAWLAAECPDAVLSSDDALLGRLQRLGAAIPGKIGFASLIRTEREGVSGIETWPEQIAGAAVSRLQQMLFENETGVPELAECVMLPGVWVDGETAPARSARVSRGHIYAHWQIAPWRASVAAAHRPNEQRRAARPTSPQALHPLQS